MESKNINLCRGKRKSDGKWVEGNYLHLNVGRDFICDGTVWIGTLAPCKEEVKPETVGRFTGETANGAQLFEGDIFRYDDELMVVEWSVPDSGYVARSLDGSNWEYPLGQIHLGCAEIVGNIHDNPELLEDHA